MTKENDNCAQFNFYKNKYCGAMISKLSIIFVSLLILCSAQGVFAQEQVEWQKYETEHFVIRYHELDENTLYMIAEESEDTYDKVTSDLQYYPDNKTIIRIGSNEDHEWAKWGGSYLERVNTSFTLFQVLDRVNTSFTFV